MVAHFRTALFEKTVEENNARNVLADYEKKLKETIDVIANHDRSIDHHVKHYIANLDTDRYDS